MYISKMMWCYHCEMCVSHTSALKQFLSWEDSGILSFLMATSVPWNVPLYTRENVPSSIRSVKNQIGDNSDTPDTRYMQIFCIENDVCLLMTEGHLHKNWTFFLGCPGNVSCANEFFTKLQKIDANTMYQCIRK